MYAVKAIYDGNNFKFAEPLPIKENYEVVITFTNPIKKSRKIYYGKLISNNEKHYKAIQGLELINWME